jgi:hypothetical protein
MQKDQQRDHNRIRDQKLQRGLRVLPGRIGLHRAKHGWDGHNILPHGPDQDGAMILHAPEHRITMHHLGIQKINQTAVPAEKEQKMTVVTEGIVPHHEGTALLFPHPGEETKKIDAKVLKSPDCGRHLGEFNSKDQRRNVKRRRQVKDKASSGECSREGFRLA